MQIEITSNLHLRGPHSSRSMVYGLFYLLGIVIRFSKCSLYVPRLCFLASWYGVVSFYD